MNYRIQLIISIAALVAATPALAAEVSGGEKAAEPEFGERSGPPSLLKTSVRGDYVAFNHGKGNRRTLGGELIRDFGATSLVLGFDQGRRDHGPGKKSYSGVRGAASLSHDWSGLITSTTGISAGSGGAVFERFRASQDVDLRAGGGTVLRLGARFTRYSGGMEVGTGSAGITQYFGGGFASYRLSAFEARGRGTSLAHLASLQLKDRRGKGSTQLWAATGSSLHDLDWLADMQKGRLSSLTVKRHQPVAGHVAVTLTAGRSWYKRPLGDYQANKVGFGLTYSR